MKKPDFKMPSIASKMATILKPKTVFNQPVCTERRYYLSRTLYSVFLTLLVLIAAATIGLKAITVNFIEDNRDTAFEFRTQDPEPVVMAALPRQLYTAPAKLALVAGAISMFVGIGHVVFVVMDWKSGKRTQAYIFRRNMMFLHFINSIVILLALISIYVTHKTSSHFSERYVNRKADRPSSSDGMEYTIGRFDLETWSCELKLVEGAGMVREDYAKQCDIETAGRGIMIPFLVVGWILCGLSIKQMIECRRDADGERIKTEQLEVEMGKMNAL